MYKVLIVDDEKNMRAILSDVLVDEGYVVKAVSSGGEAIDSIGEESYDVILLDLRLPDMTGIDVLREIRRSNSQVIVLMITAFSSVETAIEAMKLGAYDYLIKPFKIDKLKMVMENALQGVKRSAEANLRQPLRQADREFKGVIGDTVQMKQIFEVVSDLAATNSTVLIYGESGTGKELLARYIHDKSLRADMPLIKVNCAAIPEPLLESELFGHEKGAFTNAVSRRIGRFELAHRGTIFLDEVGEMSMAMQSKLLRVLQEKEFERVGGTETIKVDVRIIAATNKNLREAIKNRSFREDLYYRLSVVPITLPPLRERRGDIPALTKVIMDKLSREIGPNPKSISEEAVERLMSYSWPGNIRELENTLERAFILCKGDVILPEHLYLDVGSINLAPFESKELTGGDLAACSAVVGSDDAEDAAPKHDVNAAASTIHDDGVADCDTPGTDSASDPDSLEEVERRHIMEVLKSTKMNRTEAAKFLKITRRTLLNKIKKYGL